MQSSAFIPFAFVWLIGGALVSALWRKRTGRPIFPHLPKQADFAEAGCSGRNLQSAITSIDGARNVLLVSIIEGQLSIVPMFPFNLLFLPEIWGLEFHLPVAAIVSLSTRNGLNGTTVTLELPSGMRGHFDLRLRNPGGFIGAITSISQSRRVA